MRNNGYRKVWWNCLKIAVSACFSFVAVTETAIAEYAVKNLTLHRVGDEVKMSVMVDGEPSVRHFTLDNGERIVLDFINALHRLPQKQYRNLPDYGITAIRTSQYSIEPQRIVRLVLDMKRPVSYELIEENREVTVTIPVSESGESNAWTSEAPPSAELQELGDTALSAQRNPKEEPTLSLFSHRQVVRYREGNRRDPFEPLAQTEHVSFGSIPMPEVENLTLVGVLEDETSIRALLEDINGYGYILRKGDKVRNGVVVEVSKRRIVFRITEYGWSRTVALELETVE